MSFFEASLESDLKRFFEEDELRGNSFYLATLPDEEVECILKIKSNLILSGLPFFVGAFNYLGAKINYLEFENYEGKKLSAGSEIKFKLPFNIALSGERVALNLIQTSSSISTFTNKFVLLANEKNIKILDTRKTTPGLRNLEKYAVRIGGGYNHRMSQTDVFMIKDNHKTFFGSLENAVSYFKSLNSFYNPIVAEIHSLQELNEAIKLNMTHVMLDNFSPKDIVEAVKIKTPHMTFELSGGINLDNINNYLIEGVDAISMGAITYGAPHVDLSMKIKKLH
jgi:nicotinate-nucleotide pyrophosphorylase (carboxylating)